MSSMEAPPFVAVVGMAGRFPGAPDVDSFWERLCAGEELIRRFSDEELDEAGVPEQVRALPGYVPARAVMEEPEYFDARFFGYSPTDAKLTDPQHRVFLECSWEALENGALDPSRFDGLIGVYAGCDVNSYAVGHLLMWTHDLQSLIGNDKDYLATRVAFKLDLRGPAVTVQTACSTSLTAVQLACQALLGYQCDAALAGGVGIGFPQKAGYMFTEGGILSPDGHCRTFDAGGRGTVGGDGCGVVLLKRLEDALEDGDTIRAVIRGAAINNDGADKIGFTAPSVEGQAEVIAMAQAAADVEPDSIGYVECHGTATQLGDPIEMAALTDVFRSRTDKVGYCKVGSVKSNVGHMNSAAGVGGLIKAVLCLERERIPPSLHFETPNPEIDLETSPFRVNTELSEWPRGEEPRRAAISSFGVGGTNAHAVLEEAPPEPLSGPARGAWLFPLSARGETALLQAGEALADHLEANPELSLADVAYTLQVGRKLFGRRRLVTASNRADLLSRLRAESGLVRPPADDPKPIFMMPGQGAQYPGMTRGLYEEEPEFRRVVDESCAILTPLLGVDLRDLLYPDPSKTEAAAQRLQETSLTQPALFVLETALARLLMSWGITPSALIGHSVGEYAAACIAGVFSTEDGLRLMAERGRLIQRMERGAMLAAFLDEHEAESLAAGIDGLSVAAVNAPGVTVLSGPEEAVAAAEAELERRKLGGRRLATSHAFHSAMMDPMLDEFRAFMQGIELHAPELPFVSNLSGSWISDQEATDPDYWVRHIRRAVRFSDGISLLLAEPGNLFIEVGPGKGLGSLIKRHGREHADRVFNVVRTERESLSDLEFLLGALGRLYLNDVAVDWSAFHEGRDRRRLPLPTYRFQRERYWEAFDPATTGAVLPVGKRPDPADWLYVPSWSRKPGGVAASREEPGRWLALVHDRSVGPDLVRGLVERGERVTVVRPGAELGRVDKDLFELDIDDPESWAGLAELLSDDEEASWKVLHALNLGEADDFLTAQSAGLFSLLHLARSMGGRCALDIHVVTDGTAVVLGDEPIEPAKATAFAARVIAQEMPGISLRFVDLGDGTPADAVVDELLHGADEGRVALRGRRRWVLGYEALPSGPGEASAGGGAVVLITGGLGAIGLNLAEHLAARHGAHLVLTGRSGLVARSDWDDWLESHSPDDPVSNKIHRIRAIEEQGSRVLALSADVADEERMQQVFARAERELGPVRTVIHGAGLAGRDAFRAVTDTEPTHCLVHARPKAGGLDVLESTLPRSVETVLLMSSLSTTLGGVGLFAYAAANHYMDAFCEDRARRDGPRWLSAGWDAWLPPGAENLPVDPTGGLAAFAIRPGEGAAVLDLLEGVRNEPVVVVSTADLHLRRIEVEAMHRVDGAEDGGGSTTRERHARPELENDYVAPGNPLEEQLVEIWQDLLSIDGIGVEDNFFALGGDSLIAIQLATRLRDMLGVEIPVNELFDEATVAGLALKVESVREAAAAELDEIEAKLAMIEGLSDAEVEALLAEIEAEGGAT